LSLVSKKPIFSLTLGKSSGFEKTHREIPNGKIEKLTDDTSVFSLCNSTKNYIKLYQKNRCFGLAAEFALVHISAAYKAKPVCSIYMSRCFLV
jgi:hypothetical protein